MSAVYSQKCRFDGLVPHHFTDKVECEVCEERQAECFIKYTCLCGACPGFVVLPACFICAVSGDDVCYYEDEIIGGGGDWGVRQ